MALPEEVARLNLDQISAGGERMCRNDLLATVPWLLEQHSSLCIDQAEGAGLVEGKAEEVGPLLICMGHAQSSGAES